MKNEVDNLFNNVEKELNNQHFIQFSQLTYLDFKGCHNLSNDFICTLVEKSTFLRHLRLHNITDINHQIFDKILIHCPYMTSLSLSQCCSITDDMVINFLKRKEESDYSGDALTFLCLSNNILLTEKTIEAIALYAKQLISLDISGLSLQFTNKNDYLVKEILLNCPKLTNVIITPIKWKDFQKSMNKNIYSNTATNNENNSKLTLNESILKTTDSNEFLMNSTSETYSLNSIINNNIPTKTDYIFSNKLLYYIFCHYTQNKNIFDAMY
ncbi:hypothetical protein BCR36DRAFT_450310 [Piromyces finnis]|uniref:RNI-like protein n=1 Tax=Piromyces finnis TaxID=1754191 RepID=A0A1Y1V9G8_9FUNG|nr:hypothetical protein BCR36DRAFT_450310 [Piromyces finnis]|eukprot:ORX49665.1 hypothetical protein BCR36DRAFT_450310 [Piromyces finnis]